MATTPKPRDFRKARQPITWRDLQNPDLEKVAMAPIQAVADKSHLPQTVWPSRWYGKDDFVGHDCLLTSMAMPQPDQRPANAAEDSEPLVTVLPRTYFPVWTDDRGNRWLQVQDAHARYGVRDIPLDGQTYPAP